jgi:iron complex outermembrane receptor protein
MRLSFSGRVMLNDKNLCLQASRVRVEKVRCGPGAGRIAARALLSCAFLASSAHAQHASDDPVAAADDAFGLTIGLESIGIYGPGGVRGFNPQTAGNVRVDGLYFDQQGGLSNRVVEGSTIRVGVSEIGYAFPAPTGIVDYDLRRPGDGTASASVVSIVGPFQQRGLSLDAILPVGSKDFQLPIGVSDQIGMMTPQGSPNQGFTGRFRNFGAAPYLKLSDSVTLRAIVDYTQVSQGRTLPFVYTNGDFLPPQVPRRYNGQDWMQGQQLAENFGAILHAQISSHWSLSAGAFRSIYDQPISYADLYVNTQRNGASDQLFVANPDQTVDSNSGEARLSGHFESGAWRHDLTFTLRGRDTQSVYGGSDVVDAGPAELGQVIQLPEPNFQYSPETRDRTQLWSAGVGYRAQWNGRVDLAIGLQHENYSKTVDVPGLPESHLTDKPMRSYLQGAVNLTEKITAYAGYTQGLEDSGTAPAGAENRGAILPDARTWQEDAGMRLKIAPKVKLIVGVFQIEKPYFNFDSNNVDRMLGVQRAQGLETSISGEVLPNLNLTAGGLFGRVQIVGADLKAEGVGPLAFGQPHAQGTLNLDYKLASVPGLSTDLTVVYFGRSPASVDNVAQNPEQTILFLGARYRFALGGKPATLRVQVQNATNFYFWNMGNSPGFSQFQQRGLFGYLTVDL